MKANQGAAGVDGQSVAAFKAELTDNLYRLWNRMSSGSYFPPPVRRVMILKPGGAASGHFGISNGRRSRCPRGRKAISGTHPGARYSMRIPYGYRPGRSAIDGVRTAASAVLAVATGCSISTSSAIFDSIDWSLLLKAVAAHTDCPWVLLYIERWPQRSMQDGGCSVVLCMAGTPQGGVISPILANLFLHYAFDIWMTRTFPVIPFELNADDSICHCRSEEEAKCIMRSPGGPLCGLRAGSSSTEDEARLL